MVLGMWWFDFIRGVGNKQFWRMRFPDFSDFPVISLKNDVICCKVGGAGVLGWFPSLISRKSALISHDFNLISPWGVRDFFCCRPLDFIARMNFMMWLQNPKLVDFWPHSWKFKSTYAIIMTGKIFFSSEFWARLQCSHTFGCIHKSTQNCFIFFYFTNATRCIYYPVVRIQSRNYRSAALEQVSNFSWE